MLDQFEKFIKERRYLTNVAETTIQWYTHAFKWLDTDAPTQEDLKAAVLRMRERGLKATGCNSAIRALNSYSHWVSAGTDAKCSPACRHPKIKELKEPQNILPTFTDKQVRQLVDWKPKDRIERRLHLIMLFLFDSGARISEVLGLRVADINLDDLLIKHHACGRFEVENTDFEPFANVIHLREDPQSRTVVSPQRDGRSTAPSRMPKLCRYPSNWATEFIPERSKSRPPELNALHLLTPPAPS